LAWLTVAVTVVIAVYLGWETVLPELFAEGAIIAWIYRGVFVSRWSRMRRSMADAHRSDARRRQRSVARAKSVAHLRVVESSDDEPPPLPPDVQSRVDELLKGRKPGSD
jgi:hypothetical protein